MFRSLSKIKITPFWFNSIRKMTSLTEVIAKLENFAPKALAESWDNVGLLVEPTTPVPITSILLTNDLTEEVMDEALSIHANLIISYHPPIFSGMKNINNTTWKGRIIAKCLENKVAIYSPHTSWDAVPDGVGEWLAKALPLKSCEVIHPGNIENTGMGRLGKVDGDVTLEDAVGMIKKHIGIPHLRLAKSTNSTGKSSLIRSIAVCPGSGTSVLKNTSADLYLTGEMFHHDILEATHSGSHVILCNHSDSERGYLRYFATKLRSWISHEIKITVSAKDSDPLKTV